MVCVYNSFSTVPSFTILPSIANPKRFWFSDFAFRMMGGNDARTLVLVGKTGNGKSATGNSILGKKLFQSNRSFCGVTSSCELKSSVMADGQMLDVIDTPGLFGSSIDPETIEQIVRCINLAIDGIHAVLVVFSVSNRFFEEEKAAISRLQMSFGKQICDYLIVVFTGGDDMEEDGKTFEDFLCDCPEVLKEILCLCGNRYVLFDNRTKDETKKANQVQQLVSLVNMVVEKNGGEPYTNETFTEMKKWSRKLEVQEQEFQVLKDTKGHSEQQMFELMEKMHVKHLKRINEMFWQMTLEMKLKFEQQLLEEQAARMKVEENAEAARMEYKRELSEELEAARIRLEKDTKIARRKTEEDIERMRKELLEAKRREEEMKISLTNEQTKRKELRKKYFGRRARLRKRVIEAKIFNENV